MQQLIYQDIKYHKALKRIMITVYRELHGNLSLWSITSNDSRYTEVGCVERGSKHKLL